MQFKTKLMNQTWGNNKKPNFWPDFDPWPKFGTPKFFSWALPLLDIRHCRKSSSYATSRKTYHRNSGKWRITSFWAQIPAAKYFFSKIWFCQSLDIMVSYHHVQYVVHIVKKTNEKTNQKKLMIQSEAPEFFAAW